MSSKLTFLGGFSFVYFIVLDLLETVDRLHCFSLLWSDKAVRAEHKSKKSYPGSCLNEENQFCPCPQEKQQEP